MTGATAQQKATNSGEINPWLRQEFLSLYPNRDRHIYKQNGDSDWKVSRFRLATGLIDAAISAECSSFYGSFWGDQTNFAVLDLDAGSNYHTAQELKQLRQRLASIGLSGNVVFQSSYSGGWHLYVPFNNPVSSKEVEQALKAWLKCQGYDIRGGQLEVFPCGNGLRLPLQPGFAWLNDNAELITKREELTTEAALSRFMFDTKAAANDWSYAKILIKSQLAAASEAAGKLAQDRQERLETSSFEQLFSAGKIAEHWDKGRKFWQQGLTSAGQRHDAVLYVGHYLWYGDSENGIAALPGAQNDEYRAKLIEDWLTEKHNGFCRHVDQNKREEVKAQIKRAVLWRGDGQAREYEPYRLTDRLLKRLLAIFRKTGKVWTVEDFKQANDDRQEEARRKIRAAVAQCLEEGRQISRSTLEVLTGCSPNTLKKHSDLWRFFAIGSGEYNRGGAGAVGPLSLVPRSELSEKEESVDSTAVGPVFELSEIGVSTGSSLAPLFVPLLLTLQFQNESVGEHVEPVAAELDSLRYACSRADGEELKARQPDQSCAVYPNQSNFGVKPGLLPPACAAPPAFFVPAAYPHSQSLAPVFLGSLFYRGTSSKSKAMTRGDSLTELSAFGACVHKIIELLLKLGRSAVAEPVHQDAADSPNGKAVVFNVPFNCFQSHFENGQPIFEAGSLLERFAQQGVDSMGLNTAIQPVKPVLDVLVSVERDLDFVARHKGTSSLLAYASKHQQYCTSQCSTPSRKGLDASPRRYQKRGGRRAEGSSEKLKVPSPLLKRHFSQGDSLREKPRFKAHPDRRFRVLRPDLCSSCCRSRAPPVNFG